MAPRIVHVPLLVLALELLGCSTARHRAPTPQPRAAGAAAGASGDADAAAGAADAGDAGDADAAPSSLSATEAAKLCKELAWTLETQTNSERFCRLKALAGTQSSACADVEADCLAAKLTGESIDCAGFSSALKNCSATSAELRACFAEVRSAITAISCSERASYPPACLTQVQARCPAIPLPGSAPADPPPSPQGTCQGTVLGCNQLERLVYCQGHRGCHIENISGRNLCVGTAQPCSEFMSEGECNQQDGCEWNESEQ